MQAVHQYPSCITQATTGPLGGPLWGHTAALGLGCPDQCSFRQQRRHATYPRLLEGARECGPAACRQKLQCQPPDQDRLYPTHGGNQVCRCNQLHDLLIPVLRMHNPILCSTDVRITWPQSVTGSHITWSHPSTNIRITWPLPSTNARITWPHPSTNIRITDPTLVLIIGSHDPTLVLVVRSQDPTLMIRLPRVELGRYCILPYCTQSIAIYW